MLQPPCRRQEFIERVGGTRERQCVGRTANGHARGAGCAQRSCRDSQGERDDAGARSQRVEREHQVVGEATKHLEGLRHAKRGREHLGSQDDTCGRARHCSGHVAVCPQRNH